MTDTAVGFVIIGLGMLVVLGVVFVIASRDGTPAGAESKPPRGVHLPGPSYLPVIMAVGGSLIGAGLAFKAEGQLANPFLAVPGLLAFVLGIIAWVRAANHEWREAEHGAHDDGASH